MSDYDYLALIDDNGAQRFLNLLQIVWAEIHTDRVELHMSDGLCFTISGKGAAALTKLLAVRSISPDGSSVASFIPE